MAYRKARAKQTLPLSGADLKLEVNFLLEELN